LKRQENVKSAPVSRYVERLVGGVDDQEEVIALSNMGVRQTVDKKIIDRSAIRVADLVGIKQIHLVDIVCDNPIHKCFCSWTTHFYLPHMIDIKQTGYLSSGVMLLQRSCRVLHRHLPAGERNDTSAVIHMPWV
jgi:hypothetical protein